MVIIDLGHPEKLISLAKFILRLFGTANDLNDVVLNDPDDKLASFR
jgi:hypothetical protein